MKPTMKTGEMVDLYNSGKSVDEIAKISGFCRPTVDRRLLIAGVRRKRHGISVRAQCVINNAGFNSVDEAKSAMIKGEWDPRKERNCGTHTYVEICDKLGIELDKNLQPRIPQKHKCSSCGHEDYI